MGNYGKNIMFLCYGFTGWLAQVFDNCFPLFVCEGGCLVRGNVLWMCLLTLIKAGELCVFAYH